MRLASLGFLTEEAAKNIKRNGLMSLAALTTVAIALAVLGGALFALYRLHQFADAQPRQFEIQVFLDRSAEREQAEELQKKIAGLPGVAHVALYSREQAYAEMEQRDKEGGTGLVSELPENPFPDRLDIRLNDPHDTVVLAKALSDNTRFPEIHKVLDAREALEALFSLERIVRNIGIAAASLLFLATAFVIQNTIRLTVVARRREIRIMQLVGASPGFIRFPMMLEGIFYGVAGALIASGVVLFALSQMSQFAGKVTSPILQNLPPAIGWPIVVGVLAALGAFLGWSSSILSIRRFLKRV